LFDYEVEEHASSLVSLASNINFLTYVNENTGL